MGMIVLDEATKAWHEETQTAVVPYSSQANGLFQKMANNGGVLEKLPSGLKANYGLPENLRRFERLQRLSDENGLSLTQITLGYLWAHPFPVSAIVGPGTPEQLADTLSAADIRLTPDQATFIEGKNPLA
jgi:aryl-alcohol dehydrogenase-like predicted oxidoreductase